MADTRADLLLNPIRIRIVIAVAGRQMTAADLGAALPDVPQATLYRHINRLAEGGVLRVVAENPVRGLVQKVYALSAPDIGHLSPEDVAAMSKDDMRQLFAAFATSLIASFEQYLDNTAAPDMAADGVGFHTYPLYLTDDELRDVAIGLAEVLRPVMAHAPAPGRRRRLMATVLMPAFDEPPDDGAQ